MAGARLHVRREGLALAALGGVVLAAAIVFYAGHRTFFAAPDNSLQFWPWYQKAASVLHSGGFPLWDANQLSGHSFVGETQTGVFYPLNLIWLLALGSAQGIGAHRLDLLILLHLLIGATGFYALARSFALSRIAAVGAGIAFAFAGPVFARTTGQTAIFFGLTLVPWAVFFAHRQLETGRLRYAVASGASIGLGVLAGHFQPPFHAALIVVLLYLFTVPRGSGALRARARAEATGRAIGLGVTALAAAIVSLPQLVYSLPYFERAYRFVGSGPPIPPGGTIDFDRFVHGYSGAPSTFLSLLDPQTYSGPDGDTLYLGLGGLIVVLLLICHRGLLARQLGRYRLPVYVIAGVGILAVLGPWTLFARVLYALPFVTQVRELGRYSILVYVVLCLLLACGLDAVVTGRLWRGSRWARRLAAGLGVLLAANGLYLISNPPPGSDAWFGGEMVLGAAVLGALAAVPATRRRWLGGALVAVIAVSALHAVHYFTGRTSSPLYPPKAFARSPALTFAERACTGHRTLIVDNRIPPNVGDVFRDLRVVTGYGATMQATLYELIQKISPASAEGGALLDERCIISGQPITITGYQLAYQDLTGKQYVYVNSSASPVITTNFKPVPVQTVHFSDQEMEYRVSVTRPTTVIVSGLRYPGWNLTVDGHRPPDASFDVGQRAVFPEATLSPGTHVLRYATSGWPS